MFYPNFAQPQQFFDMWKKMVEGHITRLEALNEQMSSASELSVTKATEAIDETAKLMKSSLSYTQELASEWRKQSLEVTKQATSMMNPGV
ncbi:MAG: hypothetical protein JRI68_23260 [Deltaproteobacteria bacterium]|nr:hypothetical protein [Deltaproteobacteria bacterium]